VARKRVRYASVNGVLSEEQKQEIRDAFEYYSAMKEMLLHKLNVEGRFDADQWLEVLQGMAMYGLWSMHYDLGKRYWHLKDQYKAEEAIMGKSSSC